MSDMPGLRLAAPPRDGRGRLRRAIDRTHDLARALIEMAASGGSPTCALAAGTTAVTTRIHRLIRPHRTSTPIAALALAASAVVLMVPFSALI